MMLVSGSVYKFTLSLHLLLQELPPRPAPLRFDHPVWEGEMTNETKDEGCNGDGDMRLQYIYIWIYDVYMYTCIYIPYRFK